MIKKNSKMNIKVFGERNTGTNFLCKLLLDNTNLNCLVHGSNKHLKDLKNELIQQHFTKTFLNKHLHKQLSSLIEEQLIDKQRSLEFDSNFGWKHAKINPDRIKECPLYEKTIFICLIRNPWRFITALHKKPYNLFPNTKSSLVEFINLSFLPNKRDGIKDIFLINPVDFWNIKVNSYFHFKDVSSKVFIVYYEQLVKDPKIVLDLISPYCNVSKELKIPLKSTKGDDKTYEQYKNETIKYNPKEELGKQIYNLIYEKIDKDLLKKTIY